MNDLPYMVRKQQHRIGKAGRRSEARLKRELEGKGRPASGALPGAKGDIELGEVLLEAKSTTQESMAVKLRVAAQDRQRGALGRQEPGALGVVHRPARAGPAGRRMGADPHA